MRRERLQNDSSTTLDGGIDDTQTTITVTDGSVFPSEGDFRLLIESEIVLCTARATNDLTVVRGREGTAGASHLDDVDVTLILTEDAVEQYIKDNRPWHNYSPALRIYDASGGIIGESSFTWVNQETATASDENGAIRLVIPAAAAADVRAKVISSPSAPWVLTGAFSLFSLMELAANHKQRGGLVLRESGTGELILFCARRNSDSGGYRIEIERFASPTSFTSSQYNGGATPPGFPWQFPGPLFWLKIEDNNTNLLYSLSPDGINWTQILSEGRTAFFAGGPDQIGFAGNASSASHFGWLTVHHFRVE